MILEFWLINALCVVVMLNLLIGLRNLYINFLNNRIMSNLYDHYFILMRKIGEAIEVVMDDSETPSDSGETNTESWEEWDGSRDIHA